MQNRDGEIRSEAGEAPRPPRADRPRSRLARTALTSLSLFVGLVGSDATTVLTIAAEQTPTTSSRQQFADRTVHLGWTMGSVPGANVEGIDPFLPIAATRDSLDSPRTGVGAGTVLRRDAASGTGYILTAADWLVPALLMRSRPVAWRVRLGDVTSRPTELLAADPRCGMAVFRVRDLPPKAAWDQRPDCAPLNSLQSGLTAWNWSQRPQFFQSRDAAIGTLAAMGGSELSKDVEEEALSVVRAHLLKFRDGGDIWCSGGAWTSSEGRCWGVALRSSHVEGPNSPMHDAVPWTEETDRLVCDMEQGWLPEYGFLGLTLDDGPLLSELPASADGAPSRRSARVLRAPRRSPGERAGLQPDDLLLTMNGQGWDRRSQLMERVAWLAPGERVRFEVVRRGVDRLLNLEVALGKRPEIDDPLQFASNRRRPAWRGIQVDFATGRQRFLPAGLVTEFPRGVVVTDVSPGGVAERSGLRPGDFIAKVGEESVETPAEFVGATDSRPGDVVLELTTGARLTVGD